MRPDSAATAPTDGGHRDITIARVVMLGVGGVLILAATVTTFLAIRAEWQTSSAKADTRAAEANLADSRADVADMVSRQADLQVVAAGQSELRAQVVESWNAVAASNDTALSAATRAVELFNDGKVVQARRLLETEAGAALESADELLGTLRADAEKLNDAVEELRDLLDDAESS